MGSNNDAPLGSPKQIVDQVSDVIPEFLLERCPTFSAK
jgi:hypothetical protein